MFLILKDDYQFWFLYKSNLRISTVVNRVFPSLLGGSLIITLTVPLTILIFVEITIRKTRTISLIGDECAVLVLPLDFEQN